MTTAFDEIFVPLALELLEEFGKTVSITERAATDSYNPKTGSVNADPSSFTIKIIPPDKFKDFYVDGDLIEEGDLLTGFAASGLEFTPTKGMIIDLDGTDWTMVDLRAIYSGDDIALYETKLRM